jgi:hypothetical protein
VPARKYVGSEAGKEIQVGATSSVLKALGFGALSSRNSCGCVSMSGDQAQTTPSVLTEITLLAFWVPTTARE